MRNKADIGYPPIDYAQPPLSRCNGQLSLRVLVIPAHFPKTLTGNARCTLGPRQERVFVLMNYVIKRDAIRAFGLYFSEIREFGSMSVPPE
jgi:hypothetical protein